RQDAKNSAGTAHAMLIGGGDGLLEGVEGAGADVAVDDTDRSERQGPDAAVRAAAALVPAMRCRRGLCHKGTPARRRAGLLESREPIRATASPVKSDVMRHLEPPEAARWRHW